MRLELIRHGQTDWNSQDKLQGSSDVPLNDTGRGQALEAARVLAGAEWSAIVSSPLMRARETAQIIAAELGIELGDDGSRLVADAPGQEARFRLRLPSAPLGPVAAGPRVGVSGHAGGDAFPWRFSLEGDPTVSPYRAAVSRRRGGA